MDRKKVVLIGAGNIGLNPYIELALKADVICALNSVSDSKLIKPKEERVFEITRLPELPEIWIDPNEPVFNEHKHRQTCAKNRKKRKRRSRVGKKKRSAKN